MNAENSCRVCLISRWERCNRKEEQTDRRKLRKREKEKKEERGKEKDSTAKKKRKEKSRPTTRHSSGAQWMGVESAFGFLVYLLYSDNLPRLDLQVLVLWYALCNYEIRNMWVIYLFYLYASFLMRRCLVSIFTLVHLLIVYYRVFYSTMISSTIFLIWLSDCLFYLILTSLYLIRSDW
jgi:hypothetical protein